MQQVNSIISRSPWIMDPFVQRVFAVLFIAGIVFWILSLVCGWRLFTKAGEAGWKILVPVYGAVCRYRIIYGKGRYFLFCLLPFAGFVFSAYSAYKEARAYGRGKGFSAAHIFFRPVTAVVMAFDRVEYLGPQPLWGYMTGTSPAGKPRRYEKKYIAYDGYNEELRIFCRNGLYFRLYRCRDIPFREEGIRELFAMDDFMYQVLCSGNGSFLLAGVRASDAGEAAEKLTAYESVTSELLEGQPCETWFSLMSQRLRFEEFPGFPELITTKKGKIRKKNRKETSVEKLQPYDLKKLQTRMEISGRETQTIILVNFPSAMFEAFATELIRLSDSITLSVFAEAIDKEKCLRGMEKLTDMRPARRETMRGFLEKHIRNGSGLYNTGILINITGTPEKVGEVYAKVVRYCRKYLIAVNQLDYQQSDGFLSTLPLMENRIRYHRVMDLENLRAFLPWSRLRDAEKTVCYGKNALGEEVWYDRYANRESGFIVSDDYKWCVEMAFRELELIIGKGTVSKDRVRIVSAGPGEGRAFTLDITDPGQSDIRILAEAVKNWAADVLTSSGRTFSRDINAVFLAAERAADEAPEDLEGYFGRFLACLPGEERELFSGSTFKTVYSFSSEETGNGSRICVQEEGICKDIAYTLLMSQPEDGVTISLNSELLVMPYGYAFKMHPGTIYTFLSPDLRRFYEGRLLDELAEQCTFYLIGEHHIAEKLRLSGAVGLSKEQRGMISAPARANVVITELCDFTIPIEREQEEAREAV